MSLRMPATRSVGSLDAGLLIPASAGSAGLGLVAAQWPLIGAGAGAAVILSSLPWIALLTVLSFSAVFNKAALTVAGLTFRMEELILVPFAFRAYVTTRSSVRLRWALGEYVLVAWLGLQVLTSYLHSERVNRSLLIAALLAFGAGAYLAIYAATCTRRRLLQAARLVLWIVLIGAATGLLALVSHFVLGTTLGLNANKASGVPTVHGLAYENNIYGSGSAFGAVAFLALVRHANPLFSRRFCIVAFWMCFLALVASLTRGAWIGFGVALIAMAIVRRRAAPRPFRPERAAISLILGATLIWGLIWVATSPEGRFATGPFSIVQEKGQQLLDFTQGTGRARAAEWRIALTEVFERQPLIGLGTNSYSQRHALREGSAYLGNLYVRTLYDSGLIGLAMLIVFLVSVLWPTRALTRSTGDLAPVARALMFAWAALAVAFAGTDAMFLMWPWILLGVTRAARAQAMDQWNEIRAARRVASSGGNGQAHPQALALQGA